MIANNKRKWGRTFELKDTYKTYQPIVMYILTWILIWANSKKIITLLRQLEMCTLTEYLMRLRHYGF